MKIQTDFEVPANVNVVWDMLDDPSVIEASIPGIQSMEQIGPDHYRIVMRVGIGMIRGDFKGEIKVIEKARPVTHRLSIEGKGGGGWIKGEGLITLSHKTDEITHGHVDGDAMIGGLLARVGQRFLLNASNSSMNRFFSQLSEVVKGKLKS